MATHPSTRRLATVGFRDSPRGSLRARTSKGRAGSVGAWPLDAPLDPKNANRYGYAGGDPINASDPTGRNSTSIGGQACYGFCIGASIDFDSDGNVGYSIEFGVGSPGGGAGVTKSTGDVSNEVYAGGQCSAGPATVSAGTDGLSGGVGASYSSAYCAGYVGFSKTF